jgi:hypothetical protein
MAISENLTCGQRRTVAEATAPSVVNGKMGNDRDRLRCDRRMGQAQLLAGLQRQLVQCIYSLFEYRALTVMTVSTQMPPDGIEIRMNDCPMDAADRSSERWVQMYPFDAGHFLYHQSAA